ncbi:hypothetical protein IEQ44_14140 [Nocardioides sp. Y6]|uniref:DUF11 domain-containing protein n=1 Tax=Nocardioides malaquae TaxID=2773426 RepID=A0ABR9RW23_9ACTN|nr:SipW-dependent-type signal peptide-containing protein [Nocardioides malaquae]MBE7325789.1 hypothetical protein [Nocardioides malaquae]
MPETVTPTRRTPLRTAWRWLASVQVRLLLSLGLVLGFAAVGTSAYWADNATFTTGTIAAGRLDLQLGGRDPATGQVVWSAVGLNENWNYSVMQLDNVSPGESVAMELHIRNVGSTPLTFTGVGTSTTNSFWSGGEGFLVAKTMLGGVASNTGTREAVNRTGTCTGGTMWWGENTATLWTGNPHQLSTTPRVVTPGNAPVALAPNQEIQVCILAGLDLDAPNSIQSASTTVQVALEAKQIGAP